MSKQKARRHRWRLVGKFVYLHPSELCLHGDDKLQIHLVGVPESLLWNPHPLGYENISTDDSERRGFRFPVLVGLTYFNKSGDEVDHANRIIGHHIFSSSAAERNENDIDFDLIRSADFLFVVETFSSSAMSSENPVRYTDLVLGCDAFDGDGGMDNDWVTHLFLLLLLTKSIHYSSSESRIV